MREGMVFTGMCIVGAASRTQPGYCRDLSNRIGFVGVLYYKYSIIYPNPILIFKAPKIRSKTQRVSQLFHVFMASKASHRRLCCKSKVGHAPPSYEGLPAAMDKERGYLVRRRRFHVPENYPCGIGVGPFCFLPFSTGKP